MLFSQPDFNLIFAAGSIEADQIPFNRIPVHGHFNHAPADVLGIVDNDPHLITPEAARRREAIPRGRDAWVDPQSVRFGANSQNILGCAEITPRCRTSQP